MNNSKNRQTSVIARRVYTERSRSEAISFRRLLHSFFVRNGVKKTIFILAYLLIITSTFAQTSNKKRVLVIPPSRFEFVSEYDLKEIAEKNETTSAQVFLTYEKALLASFEQFGNENFEFVAVDASGLKPYKRLIKYEYGKFNGKHYNAVNLKLFSEADFSKLLEQYNADFVIFITWYDIQKESLMKIGNGFKLDSYAGHYLDYAIYNLFKQQIAGVAKVKAKNSEKPNDLVASYKFLRIKEVKQGYNRVISNVVDQLNRPIKQ